MTRTYGKGARLAALSLATAVALSLAAPAFAGENPLLERPIQSLQLQQAPDGTMSIDLGFAFLNVLIAQMGPDGLLHESCVNGPESAKALVTTPPAQVYVEK